MEKSFASIKHKGGLNVLKIFDVAYKLTLIRIKFGKLSKFPELMREYYNPKMKIL